MMKSKQLREELRGSSLLQCLLLQWCDGRMVALLWKMRQFGLDVGRRRG